MAVAYKSTLLAAVLFKLLAHSTSTTYGAERYAAAAALRPRPEVWPGLHWLHYSGHVGRDLVWMNERLYCPFSLYGIACNQTYSYYKGRFQDPKVMRVFVRTKLNTRVRLH